MRRFIRVYCALLFSGLLCINILNAQGKNDLHNISQIYSRTSQQLQTDTTNILNLIKLSKARMNSSPDSAEVFLRQVLLYSLGIGYNDGVARAYIGLGLCAIHQREYSKGLLLLNYALPYCQRSSFNRRELLMLYNNSVAVTYDYEGKSEIALSYFLKALNEIKENSNDSDHLIMIYQNISSALQNNRQYDKASQYLQKAYDIAKAKKDSNYLIDMDDCFANLYINEKDTLKAFDYTQRILELCAKATNPNLFMEQTAYNHLASIQDKPEKALVYLKKALSVGNTLALLETYIRLGEAYSQLGKYKIAEQNLIAGLKISEKFDKNYNIEVNYAHLLLGDMYAKLGKYKDAYTQQHIYIGLNDSALGLERDLAVNQLEVKYRTSEKDKDIVTKQLLIAKQRISIARNKVLLLLTSFGSLLLIITSLFLLFLYRNNRHKQLLQSKQITLLQQEQKILQLNSLMEGEEKERNRIARDLHDGIGGLLSAAKMSLSYSQLNQVPPENYSNGILLLDEAYRELRQTAHNLSPEILEHKGLVEAIRFFCEKIAQSKGIVINFESFGIVPILNGRNSLSVYRMLQEVMHNAIKHAHATHILLQISVEDSYLNITVEDNGIGIAQDAEVKGIGLHNLQSRIEALNGFMDIDSRLGEGTTIYLKFNILDL